MRGPVIYTIGHSNHPIEYFHELLKTHNINCLVDVRSNAASRFNPQYNKKALDAFLQKNGIIYMHFAEEFGARLTNPSILDKDGKVDFDLVRKSPNFKRGIKRLLDGVENKFTIALMCSESDPLDCHRFSMISPSLVKEGFEVLHILKDKSIITNSQLDKRLINEYEKKLPQPDVFNPKISPEDRLKVAYRLKNVEIAYSPYSKTK